MRLNKRLIKKAPTRGPHDLKIELEKLKVLKRSPTYIMRKFVRSLQTAVNTITTAIIKAGQYLFQCFKPLVGAVNNYSRYRKEDNELFRSVPSVRRFEKDMV